MKLFHSISLRLTAIAMAILWPAMTWSMASAQLQSDSPVSKNQPPQTIATNQTSFNIPFKIENTNGHYIEVQLFVSEDLGKTWKFYAKQDVNKDGIQFDCEDEGEYWFAIKSLDRNRQLIPAGNQIEPELSIIVDTEKPQVEFTIESDAAGRIISQWDIRDRYLDHRNFLIKHRGVSESGAKEDWVPVELTRTKDQSNTNRSFDRVAWWPKTTAQRIDVQLIAVDMAGNTNTITRSISRNATVFRQPSNSTTRFQQSVPPQKTTNQTAQTKPQGNWICKDGVCRLANDNTSAHDSKWQKSRPFDRLNPAEAPNASIPDYQVGSAVEYIPPPMPSNFSPAPSTPQRGLVTVQNKTVEANSNPTVANDDRTTSSIEWKSKSSNSLGQSQDQQASTIANNRFPIPKRKQPELGISDRLRNLPVVNRDSDQIINNDEIPSLQSGGNLVVSESTTISSANSSSISNSQSFVPADNRRNPNLQTNVRPASYPRGFSSQPKASNDIATMNLNTRRFNLNYGIRSIDASGVGKVILWGSEDNGLTWKAWTTDPDNVSPFPVEVDGEGIFGFRIVIHSKDGLTGKPPKSGDKPDILVHVDLTTPTVALTSAPYGSGRDVGKLVINWTASDLFLIDRPIDLSYSPNPQGPWTTIAKRLRNSGSFAWKVPTQVPEDVYLKIAARDQAGNIGVFQLTAPLDISGLVPRGQILGVEPIQ